MYYVEGIGAQSVEQGRADLEACRCECRSKLGDGIEVRTRMEVSAAARVTSSLEEKAFMLRHAESKCRACPAWL